MALRRQQAWDNGFPRGCLADSGPLGTCDEEGVLGLPANLAVGLRVLSSTLA
jgi:hypothetical protein